ncbi:Rid family hydrolase [Actinomadura oligospora]|uniref:Rid family hydrolase n=1 Tax=Actinomadura oligospora TaxID=111804 RepID=UPI00047923F2|nr:Rid family hydrolase [Actinomadura oligospora]
MNEIAGFETGFDEALAYPKAVRVGQSVWMGGTTAADPGGAVGGGDVIAQATEVLRRIDIALRQVGSALDEVVRFRVYLTDIGRRAEIVTLLRQFFPHRPASTMVEVSSLFAPDLLVQIEADAIVRA